MPIGAFISSKEIMQSLMKDPVLGHITTFGGHPVCCAAALATLKTLWESSYICKVKSKAELFKSRLKHPSIKKITYQGLLMALEIGDNGKVQDIIQKCLAKGLLTDWFLFAPGSIRIAPPLIISEEEIGNACGILLESLE
jgi:acetylornithine/succinyldiaminopimelate/putrescine aminotransferase